MIRIYNKDNTKKYYNKEYKGLNQMKYTIGSARDKQLKYPNFNLNRQQKTKYDLTEKTIEQLKKSLGSIQKMIQKSQQILKRTRHLQPRQLKSDSLDLKLTNKNNKKLLKKFILYHHPDICKQSKTSTFTNLNTTLHTQKNYQSKQSMICTKIPQKTQTVRPHLFIDVQNTSEGENEITHSKLNTNHSAVSPISAISHHKQAVEESFVESLESPLHFFRKKNKLENINDSYERSDIGESLERDRNSRLNTTSNYYTNPYAKKQVNLKKSAIDCKFKSRNTFELSQKLKSRTPKRRCIFEKPSKYENCNKNNQHKNVSKSNIRAVYQNKQKKLNKQNENVNLQDFCARVKQFGIIQKYLTHGEIVCIFQHLKKSSIPQHKWPLYAVDRIYQKMNNTQKFKT